MNEGVVRHYVDRLFICECGRVWGGAKYTRCPEMAS